MIKFELEYSPSGEEIIAPVITCDYCGEKIRDARMANVAYKGFAGLPSTSSEPIFLHKECHSRYQEQFDDAGTGVLHLWWYEMQEWFRLLENNTRADIPAWRAQIERT